jgi:hypothetical protein
MFVTGLLSLTTSPDVETAALAADLGVTAYEAGQLVRGALPAIVLRTPDGAKAEALAGKLRKRGQVALACDLGEVIASDAMHAVRGFRLEPDALVSENQNGTSERLPWSEVRCAVKAAHHATAQATQVTHERKFDLGRAVMTQGLVMTKGTTKEATTSVAQREPVLYLFRKSGAPWLLTESQGRYAALGPLVRPTRQENFTTLLRLIRERLPQVPWDERLLSLRPRAEAISTDLRGHQTGTSNASTADLLAHLVALSLAPSGV